MHREIFELSLKQFKTKIPQPKPGLTIDKGSVVSTTETSEFSPKYNKEVALHLLQNLRHAAADEVIHSDKICTYNQVMLRGGQKQELQKFAPSKQHCVIKVKWRAR
uniref:Oxidoreductase n=1 Tax=Rhizophora mucronata TaxID=61149 RepID=A0A2P2IVS6_RHIMU